MSLKRVKSDEIVVKQNDFGFLVEAFIRDCVRPRSNINFEWLDKTLRGWWPMLENYYQRHIITAIEVAIALDEPPRYNREELCNKDMWKKIVADLRGPKHPFTVKYQCSKCKTENVKLWRDYQTCASAVDLECASCLAPGEKVSEEGMIEYHYKAKDASGKSIPPSLTDQVNGKVPAIPVDDTYWGYTSVPSQDVEWWKNLPTYSKKKKK